MNLKKQKGLCVLLAGALMMLTACGGRPADRPSSAGAGSSAAPLTGASGETLPPSGAAKETEKATAALTDTTTAAASTTAKPAASAATRKPAVTAARTQKKTSTAEALLNKAALTPLRTGCKKLDQKIDELFSRLFTPGMSTYAKVKACYDYLVKNGTYGHGYIAADSPQEGIRYSSNLDSMLVDMAYGMLVSGYGVCNHYSAVFVVMTRAIGLESYYVGGQVGKKGGGYTGHAWVNIKLDGTYYVFDPQVQQGNAHAPYYYFCKTDAAMGKAYIYDDRESYVQAFEKFRYVMRMAASVTVRAGEKTYQASDRASGEWVQTGQATVRISEVVEPVDGVLQVEVTPSDGGGRYHCRIYSQPGSDSSSYYGYEDTVITGKQAFTLQVKPPYTTFFVEVTEDGQPEGVVVGFEICIEPEATETQPAASGA